MENITLDITIEKLKKILETQLDDVMKSSYSNPVRSLIEKSLTDQAGVIKKVIDAIITDAVTNPEFKTRMSDLVIQRLVESALKK